MGRAIAVRTDYRSGDIRRIAQRVKNAAQARRLLAIAAVLDGAARQEAAKIGGMDRQTLRDWVIRFNEQRPDGLINKVSPGAPGKLTNEHKAFLATEMKRIMAAPDMREKIAAVGLIPNDSPSIEEMRGYIASEHVKWGALVKQFGSRGLAIGPGGREGFAVSAAQGAAAATGQDAVAGLEWQPSVTGGLCKLLQQCRKTFREGLFF